MSNELCESQSFLSPSKKFSCGLTRPIFPAIGSTITAAISLLFSLNSCSTELRLLKFAIRVSFAIFLVTPGLSGRPNVTAPEPALIKKLSPCPW